MSLILEALRKSEAERRRGETPTLLSPINEFASHALRRAERRQRRWMWLALALIVLLVAVGGYGWQQAVTTDTDSPASAANAGISEPDVVADLPQTATPMPASPLHDAHPAAVNETLPATSSPAPTTNIARADSVPQEIPAAAPTAVTKPPAMASGTPTPSESVSAATPTEPPPIPTWIRVDQLPASEREALPPLKVSMHVYSADPAKRAVLIDGQRYQEGSWIADGILLKAIRRDGSLLEVRGRELLLGRP
ncbi:MAG: hypothetical protein E6Q42_00315 [Dechloromonas sp.]|nr:MAG: hypothetical protein E6Q42_00315 [Dechloromonas sp.]